jgi:D-glycero-alpha-D-manno-heptose 1-phosphate guanylyltransferase
MPAFQPYGASVEGASPPDGIAAVVLCGGQGSRVAHLTGGGQKVLAEVAGSPWVGLALDELEVLGFHRVILATGHRGEEVRRRIEALRPDLELVFSREPRPLGTGGALKRALDHITEDWVLVSNGDTYVPIDLPGLVAARDRSGARAVIQVTQVEDSADYGSVDLAADGEVRGFREKGVRGPGWVSSGVVLLARELLAVADDAFSLEERVLREAADRGALHAVRSERSMVDIGTVERFQHAEQLLSQAREARA